MHYLERNCNTSDKEEGSTFYWISGVVSLRRDKDDFLLKLDFDKTSSVPQSKTLGSHLQGEGLGA